MPLGKLNVFIFLIKINTKKKIKKGKLQKKKLKNIFLVSKRSRTGYGSGTNMNSMTAGGGGSGSTSLLHNGENLVKKSGSNFHNKQEFEGRKSCQSIVLLHVNSAIWQVFELCLVHVIWTEHRMSKLVLNVKYLLLLSFLTATEFSNLRHIQGIIRVH